MGVLNLQIISTDTVIYGRWEKAFRKEDWSTVVNGTGSPVGENCARRAELLLIELGAPGCRTQEEFKSILKTLQPVSTLVFGDPQKTSNSQITAFLEAGADDFFYKNIDERVLVAKLKAHLRRLIPAIAEAAGKFTSSCRSVKVDRSRREVKIAERSGGYTELLNLTQKEFDILSLLIDQERKVVTRESMLEKLWGEDAAEVYSECIDKHIESLRRKLGKCGAKIKTIYGSGYMFMGGSKP